MRFLFFFLGTLITNSIFCQNLDWIHTVQSSQGDLAFHVDFDSSGNVYYCGYFSGTVDFDPSSSTFNLTSNGSQDAYLAKYTPSGQFLWAFNIGGLDVDAVTGIKVNHANEVIICGYFRGNNIDFDPSASAFLLDAPGLGGTNNGFGGDIFLAKYSNNGQLNWAFSIVGSYSHDKPEDIEVDSVDNIYLVGAVNATSTYVIDADPGTGVFDLSGNGHAFVAKYSTSANFIWAFNYGIYGLNNGAEKIKIIPNDTTFVVTGFIRGNNIDMDPNSGIYNLSSNGVEDGVIAKYSLNKELIWAFNYGSSGIEYVSDVTIDSDKNIYIAGVINGANIDLDPSNSTLNVSSNGGFDFIIGKYSEFGNLIWAHSFGSQANDYCQGIDLKNNELLTVGGFANTVDFDPSSSLFNLSSLGNDDIFMSTYDTSGNFLCATSLGSIGDDRAYSVRRNSVVDTCYVVGYYGGLMDADPSAGITNVINSGNSDAFLGKYYKPSGNSYNVTVTGDTICSGEIPYITVTLSPNITGPFDIYYNDGTTSFSATGLTSGIPFPLPTISSTTSLSITSIIIQGSNGCQSNVFIGLPIMINIIINPSPIITCSASPNNFCLGESTIFTATGANSYQWSGGVQNGVPFIPSATNTYTVTGTNANGCSATSSITVTVNSLPNVVANASPTNVCSGAPCTLSGAGASTYQWTNGMVNGVPFTPSSNATYTVTGTDANGCTGTSSVSISILPLPTVNTTAQPDSICPGSTTVFNAVGASSYTWTGGIQNNIPFSPATSATYTVTGTDANGCTATATQSIVVLPSPNVTANAVPDSVCIGKPTTLYGGGASYYLWSQGKIDGIPFVPTTNTTYTVTGTDAQGCTNTSTVNVFVFLNLPVGIINNSPQLCAGDSAQLIGTGATNYTWAPSAYVDTTLGNSVWAYPQGVTTYTVIGTDASGCTGSATTILSTIPPIDIAVSKSNDILCGLKTTTLQAYGADQYSWTPAGLLNDASSDHPIATPTQTTTFYVTGNVGGCYDTDSITVQFYSAYAEFTVVPNAFTPNGDGLNDCLRPIHNVQPREFYFTIYNRWGQKVFESKDPQACWDGLFNGEEAPSDTYYYFLKSNSVCGDNFVKGDIILIR